MNLSPGFLIVSLLLGSVGLFYMGWGKRRGDGVMRGCGLGLLIVPMLISHMLWLLVAGAVLCALPPVARRYI